MGSDEPFAERELMHSGHWGTPAKGPVVARTLAIIAATLTSFCSAANAVQAPSDHCRAASKIEYDSAKKQYLLQNRFGAYIRTGRVWQRHYWYCQQ